jgi:hypothetical protein
MKLRKCDFDRDTLISIPLQILLLQRGIHHRVHGEHRVFQFSLCALCDLCGSKQKSANIVNIFSHLNVQKSTYDWQADVRG